MPFDYKKFALKSRAILGIVIYAAIGISGELGLSFGEVQGALITERWDYLLQTLSLVMVVIGIRGAETPITFMPNLGTQSKK